MIILCNSNKVWWSEAHPDPLVVQYVWLYTSLNTVYKQSIVWLGASENHNEDQLSWQTMVPGQLHAQVHPVQFSVKPFLLQFEWVTPSVGIKYKEDFKIHIWQFMYHFVDFDQIRTYSSFLQWPETQYLYNSVVFRCMAHPSDPVSCV